MSTSMSRVSGQHTRTSLAPDAQQAACRRHSSRYKDIRMKQLLWILLTKLLPCSTCSAAIAARSARSIFRMLHATAL